MAKELISIKEIRAAAQVLRAIKHPLRYKILNLLEENEALSVTEIYEALGIDQSVCSGHLAILRREGIIANEPSGKIRYYSLVEARLEEIKKYAKALTAK